MARDFYSPFDVLEKAFGLLAAGPEPLSLEGRLVRGLPDRAVPLDELRTRLLHPSTTYQTRDFALAILLRRAKRESGAWTVGLSGMLLPGLRRAAAPMTRAVPSKAEDIEGEMLAGLVEAIAAVPEEPDRLAARLVWPAVRAGHRLATRERARLDCETPRATVLASSGSPGHPDLVLAAAVNAGVLSADEAELIGETRIGGVPLRVLARRWGVPYDALRKRRARAEPALVAWLLSRQLSQEER